MIITCINCQDKHAKTSNLNAMSLLKPSAFTITVVSVVLRVGFLLFGLYQDSHMEVPYTDIDYYVFTDAARFVVKGGSPYLRETYRYTPLLSWFLVPTAWEPQEVWFHFGKILFIVCDLVTGILSLKILQKLHRDTRWSLLWLLNPMVITISTRGSSESLLTVMVMASLYYIIEKRYIASGLWLGLAIHLKIYPFLYIPAMVLFIDPACSIWRPITRQRLKFCAATAASFLALTYLMYAFYGNIYIDQAFLYHLRRLDHRHNFSIYNVTLYFTSFTQNSALSNSSWLTLEKLAFVPQLFLSFIVTPLALCYKNADASILVGSCFIQTFIFIAFNKVITSQYFIWFLCLLPVYISGTTISMCRGAILVAGWVITQALWLWYGYRLEFQGEFGIFHYGLWTSSCFFFIWNCIMAHDLIADVRKQRMQLVQKKQK